MKLKRPRKRHVGMKSLTKATRLGRTALGQKGGYQPKGMPSKPALAPSYAVKVLGQKPKPLKLGQRRPFIVKPLFAVPSLIPSMKFGKPRPLGMLKPLKPLWRPPMLRFRITSLLGPPPDVLIIAARKALERQIKTTKRKARKFDKIAHYAVNEMVRRERLDLKERKRQYREATREFRRFAREETYAAKRADRQRKATLKTPQPDS
jgi:hypothetical protein